MTATICLLIFGGVVIGLEVLVMIKRGKGWGPQSLRVIGISLILIMAPVIISLQLTGDLMAVVFGLYGTIAGYLMGKPVKGDLD